MRTASYLIVPSQRHDDARGILRVPGLDVFHSRGAAGRKLRIDALAGNLRRLRRSTNSRTVGNDAWGVRRY